MKILSDVELFYRSMQDGHLIGEAPRALSPERSENRLKLLREELDEYQEAIKCGDTEEIADALADLLYILSGAVLEHGLQGHFQAIWDAVQSSNLSKTCPKGEQAPSLMKLEKEGAQVIVCEDPLNDFVVFKRASDMKILKPLNYHPVDINSILAKSTDELKFEYLNEISTKSPKDFWTILEKDNTGETKLKAHEIVDLGVLLDQHGRLTFITGAEISEHVDLERNQKSYTLVSNGHHHQSRIPAKAGS